MKNSSSLLRELLQSLPQTKAQIYFKASLTAISHAMEDLVLAGSDRPLVIANFQQERFYRQEAARYRRIAQCSDQVYVLAAPETDFASAPAPFSTIGLEPTDELAQEWHLVIVGQHYSACLICREYAAPVDAIALDSARQFRGFWTLDPNVSRQAAMLLLRRIGRYRPDLASQIAQAKQQFHLTGGQKSGSGQPATGQPATGQPATVDAQLFGDRLVTYLQASQYRQVKDYRRIVAQERQERLLNQITAAIRRSLQPEEILAVTVQEVARLFMPCRCLLYRLPQQLLTSASSTASKIASILPEYESVHPISSGLLGESLLGKQWQLGTHPQFQPILERGNIVAIADTSQDSGIQAHPDLQRQLQQAQVQSCLLVPIADQQQCLAVLELHRDTPNLWSVGDRDLLAAIATQAGLALVQTEAYVNLTQLNQQLVAIKQTQNNLIAIVGHELRTPLSTIQVCLESLESEPNMALKFRQSMVETALADSERLRRLIQDFLLLSRLESGLTTYQLEPIDLADAIALVVCHLQKLGQPRDLPNILVNLPPNLPLAIADGEVLFQLLSKLLDNACKFTPPTGEITLTARHVERSNQQPMVEVEIADTGCGIEANQLETIFERFHQEEGFLQRAVGGAGLGLAICRQLVRQLGGRMWATSLGKGQGSQFYVVLPALAT